MDFKLNIIAITIGYYYAKKYGREAVEKINQFNADKERQQQNL